MRHLIKILATALVFSIPTMPAHAISPPKSGGCVGDIEYRIAKHSGKFYTKAELEQMWGVVDLGSPAYSPVFHDMVVRYPRCGPMYDEFPDEFYGVIYWRKRGKHRPFVAIYYTKNSSYIGGN